MGRGTYANPWQWTPHLWASSCAVALAVVMSVRAFAEQHDLVAKKLISVARQCAAHAHATPNVSVQVIMVVIVVPIEVVLHTRPRVRKKIVMCVVVPTPIKQFECLACVSLLTYVKSQSVSGRDGLGWMRRLIRQRRYADPSSLSTASWP
jgi:hypothetical protein